LLEETHIQFSHKRTEVGHVHSWPGRFVHVVDDNKQGKKRKKERKNGSPPLLLWLLGHRNLIVTLSSFLLLYLALLWFLLSMVSQ